MSATDLEPPKDPVLYSHPLYTSTPCPVPSSDDGDLCVELQPDVFTYTHRVLFGTDKLVVATGKLCPRGLEIHHPSASGGETALKRLQIATIAPGDYPQIVDALTQHALETRDFTLVVRASDSEKVLDRIRVHRGLLAARIPYFRSLFSGGFKDSLGDEATLRDDVVTASAARRVAAWCALDFDTAALGLGSVKEALELAVAADFLCADDLWAFALASAWSSMPLWLVKCDVCAVSIPAFLEGVEASPVLKERLQEGVQACLRILATPEGVRVWKRPLISMSDAILKRLVATAEEYLAEQGSKNAYRMFLFVSELAAKVKTSPLKTRWEEMLLHPVSTACARVAAAELGDRYLVRLVKRVHKLVVCRDKSVVDEFLQCVAGTVERRNVKVLLFGLADVTLPDSEAVEKAREIVLKWLKKEWLSIAVDGGFAEWEAEEREYLASKLGIAVEDLGVTARARRVGRGHSSGSRGKT
ncbi:hypothetical protein BZA05DRAFT_410332 [Tricharina praecox]|uniref:uncharacterized protein n=1 Tax=Tricharina praecox TaxID=43433 RepID=UPI00221EB897|nr:uncharacterized protein BZA05DRAFT_410332 [Tricharina praecox]KAI5843680.1 hypothetical protein BZA05DRAFT_410332 [Tricharina praecox]